jgi:hypothetical protein
MDLAVVVDDDLYSTSEFSEEEVGLYVYSDIWFEILNLNGLTVKNISKWSIVCKSWLGTRSPAVARTNARISP